MFREAAMAFRIAASRARISADEAIRDASLDLRRREMAKLPAFSATQWRIGLLQMALTIHQGRRCFMGGSNYVLAFPRTARSSGLVVGGISNKLGGG
jgi:hypothetical protein